VGRSYTLLSRRGRGRLRAASLVGGSDCAAVDSTLCIQRLLERGQIDIFHDIDVAPALVRPVLCLAGDRRQRELLGGIGLFDQLIGGRLTFEWIGEHILEIMLLDE